MPSSLIDMGRAAVLLLFLLGIPAAAVLGLPRSDDPRGDADGESPQLVTVQRPVDESGERPVLPLGSSRKVERAQRWLLVQQRLQRLGALYYRLEKDSRRDEYYFVCCLPGQPTDVHRSQATDRVFRRAGRDPLLVVESVAADIGLWLEQRAAGDSATANRTGGLRIEDGHHDRNGLDGALERDVFQSLRDIRFQA